jgi:hypothetical protein
VGRHFTSPNDIIVISTAAHLAGFNYTSGTGAVVAEHVSLPAGGEQWVSINTPTSTFEAAVNSFWDADSPTYWDGANGRTATSITIPTNEQILLAWDKFAGTAVARFHLYRFRTNTWVHANTNGTNVDSTTVSQMCLGGNADDTTSIDADVWAIGIWPDHAMEDGEVERLAKGNWLNYNPAFYEQWSDGREVNDMTRTLGRYPVRQTSRSGTTRGVNVPPPGFRMDARRRRR